MPNNNAVVLLSGGLDSTTVLKIAQNDGFGTFALSFDYGQKNRFEFEKARKIAGKYQVLEHRVVKIDLAAFGGSSLTTSAAVEKNRSLTDIGKNIPSTYVPVRNTIFLTYALAWAEVLGVCDIFIGVNAIDTSGYPDCRPEYIQAYERLANLATRLGTELSRQIKIHAPLQNLNKCQIIKKGFELGVDYSLTTTCYDPLPNGAPCQSCDACILRRQGFLEAGYPDPVLT